MRYALTYTVILASLVSRPLYAGDDRLRFIEDLIEISENDVHHLDNLFRGRGIHSFKQTVDYSRHLTPNFIHSIREQEQHQINESCNGSYRQGEICGIDYSPITCGQDAPIFTYKIIHSESNKATITAQHLDYPEVVTYYLLRDNNLWKIDGVDCWEAIKFNAP